MLQHCPRPCPRYVGGIREPGLRFYLENNIMTQVLLGYCRHNATLSLSWCITFTTVNWGKHKQSCWYKRKQVFLIGHFWVIFMLFHNKSLYKTLKIKMIFDLHENELVCGAKFHWMISTKDSMLHWGKRRPWKWLVTGRVLSFFFFFLFE